MKTYLYPSVALLFGLLFTADAIAYTSAYETMEQYCLATNADTAENCACGQAKADELLTPEEQQLVIGLMAEDPNAMIEIQNLDGGVQALMGKVEQIFEGCE